MNAVAAADRDRRGPAPAGRTLVLGMGSTGASCARHFAARGVAAVFADTRAEPPGLAAIEAAIRSSGGIPGTAGGMELLTGGIPATLPAGVTRVVVSPGIDLGLPVLADARARGIEILSDIDLFVDEARAPIVAITGSNGKSTVTSMLGAMLAEAGWRVGVGGNLGTRRSTCSIRRGGLRAGALQLPAGAAGRCPAAAVVLNVSPDHLDVHGGMQGYVAAKARVYAACKVAVVNRDAPEAAALVPPGIPAVSFGLGVPEAGQFGLRVMPDGLWLARGWDHLVQVARLQVSGRHNVANALAALALANALADALSRPAEMQALLSGLCNYRPLPHRMAVVATTDGITWIDDSKATNVGAAVTSIGSVDDRWS